MDLHELIRLWRRRFIAASAAFTVLLSCLVVLAKYEQAASETSSVLTGLVTKVSRMRIATVEMRRALTSCRGLLPPGYGDKTADALLFDRVDDLKTLFPGSQLTISAPAELPEGATILFSATVAGGDYSRFLNAFAAMQTRSFPFVAFKSISIGYDQPARGSVVYKLEGTIVTPAHDRKGGGP